MMIGEKFVPTFAYQDFWWGGDDKGPYHGFDQVNSRSTVNQPLYFPSNPHQDYNVPTGLTPDLVWTSTFVFGAAHPAGINAVFADGSVHNVKYGIDAEVFNELGKRDDGAVLTSDDY